MNSDSDPGFTSAMYRLYYKWLRIIAKEQYGECSEKTVKAIDVVLRDRFCSGQEKHSMDRKKACAYMEEVQRWSGEWCQIVLPGEGVDP